MRRVATLIVAIGLTVTGIGTCGAIQPEAPGRVPAPARLTGLVLRPGLAGPGLAAGPGQAAGPGVPAGTKVVSFDGYTIDVPASWPVYRLATDPARCVRYDRHAVYLGPPGPDQLCPAHLVGRVATISLQASGPPAPQPPGEQWGPARPRLSLGGLQAGGVVLQDAQDHQLWGTFPHQGLTVTATYAASPSQVSGIIRTLRWAGPAATGPAAAGQPATGQLTTGQPTTGQPATGAPVTQDAQSAAKALALATRPDAVGRASGASHRRAGRHPIRGFDTCSTPSLQTMRIWHRVFSAMAIYIGGPEAGCGFGSLSASWVRAVTAMGWALIPTYVGRQAPCTRFQVRIRKGHARAQGIAAAQGAVGLAASLGIGRGAPIYDDMEFYNPAKGICRRQVLSFLNGWTRELHRLGYRSGVYSSASAAAANLGRASRVYQWRLAKPNSIWFALWDGRANLNGTPYVLPAWWPSRRLKQYMGGHRRRIGGIALNIDSDLVDGAVYR